MAEKLHDDFKIDSDFIINNYTLLPVYSPFISEKRRNEIIHIMKKENGNRLKTKLGIISGSICRKKQLYYCPQCAKEEIGKFDEAYFHRLHQVQGVLVCEKHNCLLKAYKNNINVSRLKYISLSETELDFSRDFIENQGLSEKLINVATEVKFLLNNSFANLNQNVVYKKYLMLLNNKGLITPKGNIRQVTLFKEFTNYYGTEFLEVLDSTIEMKNEYNWLKIITRKPKRTSHPIRHILLIGFLCGGLKEFVKMPVKSINYSGNELFPCLNPTCKNYNKLIIQHYKVTSDYKTREPVGTFSCKCGFTYSRKLKNDKYKIGRIKNFGSIWENRLKELVECNNSIRSIATVLKCDCKTVIKYADKMGLKDKLNTHSDIKYILQQQEKKSTIDGEKYKSDITQAINQNPQITVKEIKKNFYKQYIWLYKNEKEWLELNISKLKNYNVVNYERNNAKLWENRDDDILSLLTDEYKNLMNQKKLIRITKSLLGRRIGKSAQLEKYLHKLPKTKVYLDKICETVEEFQIRRIDCLCFNMIQNYEPLAIWRIKRLAGLKNNISKTVEDKIYENINKYNAI